MLFLALVADSAGAWCDYGFSVSSITQYIVILFMGTSPVPLRGFAGGAGGKNALVGLSYQMICNALFIMFRTVHIRTGVHATQNQPSASIERLLKDTNTGIPVLAIRAASPAPHTPVKPFEDGPDFSFPSRSVHWKVQSSNLLWAH